MFVAASTRCFADLDFFAACEQIAELDYDKIEIWLDERGDHLKPSEAVREPEAFAAKVREATRLTPVALCLAGEVDRNVFRGLCKLSKLLRVTQITVPSSPVGTPFNEEVDRLVDYVAIASEDGIRVSIPTCTGRLSEDPHTAVELCQSIKGLGLTLDPSHFICGPHRGASIEPLLPHVYHVHLRDTSPDRLQVPVGLGEVDYSRLINQLNRRNYRGALAVEFIPDEMDLQQRPLEMRKIRMLLETLL